jgi:hypothetical protein
VALALASAALTVALRTPMALSPAPLPAPFASLASSSPAPLPAPLPLPLPAPVISREPPVGVRAAAYPPPPLTPAQQAALGGGRRAIWETAGLSWTQPDSAKGPEFGPARASSVLATSHARDVLFRRPQAKVTLTMAVVRSPDEGVGGVDERVRELLGRAEQRVQAGATARAYRLDLDGVRGVVAQAAGGAVARGGPALQWVGYRERGGAIERVEISFEVSSGQFARHLPTAQAVLYSFRFFGAG